MEKIEKSEWEVEMLDFVSKARVVMKKIQVHVCGHVEMKRIISR